MIFILKSFRDLSVEQLYDSYRLRSSVFVVEQNCVYQDIDEKDKPAFHVLMYSADGLLAGYCRLLPPGVPYDQPSIGRVVVDQNFRDKGHGVDLMNYAIINTLELFSSQQIVISAQQYLTRFYTELGFAAEGNVYDEDGIPHIKMRYSVK